MLMGCSASGGKATDAPVTNPMVDAVVKTPVTIASTLTVAGADLAFQVSGNDRTRPILLVLHGGPGYAMIDFLHRDLPALEDQFVVITYDQRGAGLSYRAGLKPAQMTLKQFAEDADAIRKQALLQLQRPNDKVVVMGHSMGTMIGLELIHTYPANYQAYVGVGQVVNVALNEQGSYDQVLADANASNNAAAKKALNCVGRPTNNFEYLNPGVGTIAGCTRTTDGFSVTNEWVGFFGHDIFGQTSTDAVDQAILAGPAYQGKEQQWNDGAAFSDKLFNDPRVVAFDSRVSHINETVPIYVFIGAHDFDTPAPLAESYATMIQSKHEVIRFAQSAHFPFHEERGAFLAAMMHVEQDSH
jgi:pimeloyl-ACP methyl ester carboxylesterase